MAQILLPDQDIATGTWSATPLWSKVDDDSTVNASGDGTTILSGNNTSPDNADLGLTSGSDPGASTNHILRARWNKDSSGGHSINAVLELWEGTPGTGTLIATLSVTGIGATEQEDTYTLSSAEADSITDYSNLNLRVSRQGDTGGNPNDRRSLVVDLVEFEIPDAAADQARMEVSWAELETPETPTNLEISWAELEVPDVARMEVSWAELEVPDVARIELSWAELETPESPTDIEISWAELETPDPVARLEVSWAEMEVPESPTSLELAWAELEVPSLSADGRIEISWAELETPDTATRLDLSWAELEAPESPTRLELSWAELEAPESPTRLEVSWAELQMPDVARLELSWAEMEFPDSATRIEISWAEVEIPEEGEGTERKLKLYVPGQLLLTGGE